MEQKKKIVGLDEFFSNLSNLSKEDFTYLKRNYNKSFYDLNNRVLISFFKVLPLQIKYKEYIWFFCATLFCYRDGNGNISLAECVKKVNDENIKIKFNNILKETLDSDSLMLYKLGQLVRLLNQNGYKINIKLLLSDLLFWNSDSSFIQKKWAKEVYSKPIIIEKEGENENE